MASLTKPSTIDAPEESNRLGFATAVVADVAGAVATATVDAVAKLPDVAATSRSYLEDANRRIQGGSAETLTLGIAVSFGFAVGLLVGGASRLLVAAALVPVGMMGMTLLDRPSQLKACARGGLQGR